METYLRCTDDGFTIGAYLITRTVLEQCAFTIEARNRLSAIAAKPDKSWLPKGEEFFSLTVRLRFATSNKALQKSLQDKGFPPKLLKPINVMTCVAALGSRPELAHLAPVYDMLCDHIHHNGPSHFTSSSGFFIGNAGLHHASGSGILTTNSGPISRYEYPNVDRHNGAIKDTATTILLAAKSTLAIIEILPRSPFSIGLVEQITGTPHGLALLGQVNQARVS